MQELERAVGVGRGTVLGKPLPSKGCPISPLWLRPTEEGLWGLTGQLTQLSVGG